MSDRSPGLDELSRSIGALESQVRVQGRQLERLTDILKEDQRIHAQVLFDMRESLSGLHNTVTETTGIIKSLTDRVTNMEPEVRHYTEFRYTSKGALWAFRAIYWGSAAIVGAISSKIIHKIWP